MKNKKAVYEAESPLCEAEVLMAKGGSSRQVQQLGVRVGGPQLHKHSRVTTLRLMVSLKCKDPPCNFPDGGQISQKLTVIFLMNSPEQMFMIQSSAVLIQADVM